MQTPLNESHLNDQNNRNASSQRDSNSNDLGDSLSSSSSNNAFTANLFKPTATHFYLRRKRTATTYIPESAERTKRLYPELQADQDFLHQMLDIWSSKLEQLKMDEQILERMVKSPKSKLQGVPTLFSQSNDTQTFDTTIIDASSYPQNNTKESRMELENQELQEHTNINNGDDYNEKHFDLDQNEAFNNQEENSLDNQVDNQADNDSGEDEELLQQWNIQSEEEDNDEEDEEATRRALTFMLAEFGDELE